MRKKLWHIARLVRNQNLRCFPPNDRSLLSYLCVGLFILVSAFSSETSAQSYLSVRNLHRPVRTNFKIGDELAIKIDGESTIYRGTLSALNDSSIVFDDVTISLDRINMVLAYDSRSSIRNLSNSAFMAIPIFIVYTALHRLVNTGERPIIEKNALVLSAVYGGLGLILRPFSVRRFKIGRKWDLKVVDTSFYQPD